jgi:hypothetical protein
MEWYAAKALALVRAHQLCEGCGTAFADDVHHRQPRGMGGVHGAAAREAHRGYNLLALCRRCHDLTEAEPALCRAQGWLVPHPIQVALIPALIVPIYGRAWYYLDAEFGYRPCNQHRANGILRGYGLVAP